jgi:hypothetical protein
MSAASGSAPDLDSIAASIAKSIWERAPKTHNGDAFSLRYESRMQADYSAFHTSSDDLTAFTKIYTETLLQAVKDHEINLNDVSMVELLVKVKYQLSKITRTTPSLVAAEESTKITTIAQCILDRIEAEREGRLQPDSAVCERIFQDEIAHAIQEYGQGSGKEPIHDLEQKVHDEMVRITTGQDNIGEEFHWPESL